MLFLIELSKAQRSFANVLNEFRLECIGEIDTDDEMEIGKFNMVQQYSYYSVSIPLPGLWIPDSNSRIPDSTPWIPGPLLGFWMPKLKKVGLPHMG